jgi:hypothetical protein
MSRQPSHALWPVLAALLAGCSAAQPSATPSPAVTPTTVPASTSPTPTLTLVPTASPTSLPAPTPSPTPTPVDVAGIFVDRLANVSTLQATTTGTLTVGSDTTDITGETRVNTAGDTYVKVTCVTAGMSQTQATIRIGDQLYKSRDAGPFVAQPPAAASQPQLLSLLSTLASLTDTGVVSHLGQQLHHLLPPTTYVLDPAVLGISDARLANVQASVDFYAMSDGTPASMAASAEWQYQTPTDSQPATLTLEVVFISFDQTVLVQAPTEVWQLMTSRLNKLSIGYPADWQIKLASKASQPDKAERPDGTLTMTTWSIAPAFGLAKDVDYYASQMKRYYGTRLDSTEDMTVDGQPGKLLKMTPKGNTGARLYVAAVTKGGRFWVVELTTGPDPDGDGLAWLRSFVTTFHLRA